MARRKSDAFTFGSDSFLDVVANMVGILIILIVLVGLRVRHAPKDTKVLAELGLAHHDELLKHEDDQRAAEEAHRRAMDDICQREEEIRQQREQHFRAIATRKRQAESVEKDNAQRRAEYDRQVNAIAAERQRRAAEIENTAALQRVEDDKLRQREKEIQTLTARQRQWKTEAEDLRRQIAALQSAIAGENKSFATLKQEYANVSATTKQRAQQIALLSAERDTRKSHADEVDQQLVNTEAELADLRKQLEEIKKLPGAKQNWVHFPTPVAQLVRREEIHYRCLDGRVAPTHLHELLEQVKRKLVSGALDTETATGGIVGPMDGFRLRFIIMRAKPSLLDRVNDPYTYRLQLTRFELEADSNMLGETREQVLLESSRFWQTLQNCPPESFVITIWVYPNSFAVAKVVQQSLHQRGYQVALRPLPFGIPISGSPSGATSLGQ